MKMRFSALRSCGTLGLLQLLDQEVDGVFGFADAQALQQVVEQVVDLLAFEVHLYVVLLSLSLSMIHIKFMKLNYLKINVHQ